MHRILLGSIIVLLLLSISANVFIYLNSPKVAYVRSHDLINQYAGTIEARSAFEKKKSAMVANVDSLKMHLERSAMQYKSQAGSMTTPQRVSREQELNQLQEQFYQYSSAIDQKIREEDEKMMGAVLNQVNSSVEEYAVEKGFDVIMGTTLSGSLLYGKESLDITDDLLLKINNKYKGK